MWTFERMNRFLKGLIKNQAHVQASLVQHARLWRSTYAYYMQQPQRFDIALDTDVDVSGQATAVMPAYAYALYEGQMPIKLQGAVSIKELDGAAFADLHWALVDDWLSDPAGRCLVVDPSSDKSAAPQGCYGQLWRAYLVSQGFSESTNREELSSAETLQLLEGWRSWAAAQEPSSLTERQRALCYGPDRRVQTATRASIGGVMFRAARLDATAAGDSKKSANSYFVANVAEGALLVGRFLRFFAVAPPSYSVAVASQISSELQYAEVEWLATPTPCKTKRSMLPFVYDTRVPGQTSVWLLSGVKPVPIALPLMDKGHDLPGQVKWQGRLLTAEQRKRLRAVLTKDDWVLIK